MRLRTCLLVVCLLGGCLGTTTPKEAEASPPSSASGQPVGGEPDADPMGPDMGQIRFRRSGSLNAWIANTLGHPGHVYAELVEKRLNVTRIEATLHWNSTVPGTDLDVSVAAPGADCVGGFPTQACLNRHERGQFVDMQGHFQNRNGSHGAPDNPSRLVLDEAAIASTKDLVCGQNQRKCVWLAYPLAKVASGPVQVHLEVVVDYRCTKAPDEGNSTARESSVDWIGCPPN